MSERRAKQARRLERLAEKGTADRGKKRVGLLSRPEVGSWDPAREANARTKLRRSFRRMLES
jgi:hypothetical protein